MKYQTYEKYKDSRIDWLNGVPEKWVVKKIKWESPVFRGASHRPIEDPVYFDDEGEYAWVRISDVTASNTYLMTTQQRLSDYGAKFSVKLSPDSLFLSIAGSVGKPCITKIKCCIHDGFVYFPKLDMSSKFLYYVFASGEPYKGLGKLGTQLNLNTETVGSIHIAIPSKKEQESIVNFLDRETAHIDALIEKKQKLIDLLKEKRTALITKAVTKGLNPDVKMKDSGIEWLGEVPEHWKVKKLKISHKTTSGGTPKTDNENYYDGNIPWLRTLDLNNDQVKDYEKSISNQAIKDSATKLVPSNSVLIAMYGGGGTIGKSGLLKFRAAINQAICAILPNNEDVPEYLHYFIIYYRPYWMVGAEGTRKDPNISQDEIKNQILVFPPKEEQLNIVNYLNNKLKKIDSLISKTEQSITKQKEYRTALISAAVTGKIKVSGQ